MVTESAVLVTQDISVFFWKCVGFGFLVLVTESAVLVTESAVLVTESAGFGYRISGFGYRIIVTESAVLVTESAALVTESAALVTESAGCGYRISGFGYRIRRFGYRIRRFSYRISAFSYRISAFSYRIIVTESDRLVTESDVDPERARKETRHDMIFYGASSSQVQWISQKELMLTSFGADDRDGRCAKARVVWGGGWITMENLETMFIPCSMFSCFLFNE